MDATQRAAHPRMQWNAGGWFGALLGCTLWMLAMGVVVLGASARAGAVAMVLWALAVGWGLWLWTRRRRLGPLAGVQWMLLGCGLAGAGVLAALALWGGSEAAARLDRVSSVPVAHAWWWLLVYPALMLVFWLAFGRRRTPQGDS